MLILLSQVFKVCSTINKSMAFSLRIKLRVQEEVDKIPSYFI